MYLPVKGTSNAKIGLGIYAEQHQKIHNGFFEGYDKSAGVDLLVKSISTKKMNNFPGRAPAVGPKAGKSKDFYGIDIGAGAQFILGVDLNLKIGFNH